MARCMRCNRFMLVNSHTGYCNNCNEAIAMEEQRIRQEEAQRKAEIEKKQQDEQIRRKYEEERNRREEERRKAEEELKRMEEETQRVEKERLRIFRAEENKKIRIQNGLICEDFPLRCNIHFGDTIGDIIGNETQNRVRDKYVWLYGSDFIKDTENIFESSINKDTSNEDKQKLIQDFWQKYSLKPFDNVFKKSIHGDQRYLDNYKKGEYVLFTASNGFVPIENEYNIWYLGTIVDIEKCLIHYQFDNDLGLTALNYRLIDPGYQDFDRYGFPETVFSKESGKKMKSYLISKYGETHDIRWDKGIKKEYIDIFHDIIQELGVHESYQPILGNQLMWIRNCYNGNVVIIYYDGEKTCRNLFDCYGKEYTKKYYSCDIIYYYFPKTQLQEKINHIRDLINEKREAEQNKLSEL